jgi:uncharacterized protein
MHHRLAPKQHRFNYQIFMFYLNLEEINSLDKRLKLLSRNRFNLFNFRDKDHLQLPADKGKETKEQIMDYLRMQGITTPVSRIMLLTNLCTLGYQFNPVSFYFCYDEQDKPLCSVVEVCNTFKELKPYLLNTETFTEGHFRLNTGKYFYVSPFTDMDANFDFNLQVPGEKLSIRIDNTDKNGERFFISTLQGTRVALTDANMLYYFLSFPFITLKVIWLIHWQAFKLWIKKLPYHAKAAHQDLQRDLYRPYKS